MTPTRRPGRLAEFWRYFRENRGAVTGLWVFPTFLIVAVFADVLAPYDPAAQFRDHVLQPPVWQDGGSWRFPLAQTRWGATC